MRLATRMSLIAFLATLSACGSTRAIRDVVQDPSNYSNRDVQVEGRVVQSYSILGQGAYRVEDETGQLWVVSTSGVPGQGAQVSVKGRVQEGYNISGIIDLPGSIDSAVVMIESSHRTK